MTYIFPGWADSLNIIEIFSQLKLVGAAKSGFQRNNPLHIWSFQPAMFYYQPVSDNFSIKFAVWFPLVSWFRRGIPTEQPMASDDFYCIQADPSIFAESTPLPSPGTVWLTYMSLVLDPQSPKFPNHFKSQISQAEGEAPHFHSCIMLYPDLPLPTQPVKQSTLW